MIDNSLFQVRRVGRGTISGLLPASVAKVIGTAYMISAKDADTGENTFALATGRCDGFVTKAIRTTEGMSDTELANMQVGLMAGDTGDFDGHFVAGKSGSIDLPLELEVEGSDYVVGSAADYTDTSGSETKLSFDGGKFTPATSGTFAQYRVKKKMTPITEGNVRLYVQAIEGYLVP